MMTITDPNTLFTREGVAKALTAAGYPIATGTLAQKAVRGDGPPYQKFGRKPLYRWKSALEWAEARTGKVVSSTSEDKAA